MDLASMISSRTNLERKLPIVLTVSIVISSIICLQSSSAGAVHSDRNINVQTSNKPEHQAPNDRKQALEDELNSIVRQHGNVDSNEKTLAETIISRLLFDNLTGNSDLTMNDAVADNELGDDVSSPSDARDEEQPTLSGPTAIEALRLRKLLNLIHNYEGLGNQVAFSPFPVLPGSQAAAMKRATKFGSLLKQQRLNNYKGNSFDFGLGKRPDLGATNGVSRIGDSLISSNGLVQPVSQFGKRPSAHRYDFGLGKRVPTYPRYDFGLGKRAPSYARYDFGLGK